jgi:hypothetical protein
MKMRKSGSTEGHGGDSPSQLIDARIEELGDWRGETLARIQSLIKQADPEVVEEWKWRGVPVWPHAGIICTGEISGPEPSSDEMADAPAKSTVFPAPRPPSSSVQAWIELLPDWRTALAAPGHVGVRHCASTAAILSRGSGAVSDPETFPRSARKAVPGSLLGSWSSICRSTKRVPALFPEPPPAERQRVEASNSKNSEISEQQMRTSIT